MFLHIAHTRLQPASAQSHILQQRSQRDMLSPSEPLLATRQHAVAAGPALLLLYCRSVPGRCCSFAERPSNIQAGCPGLMCCAMLVLACCLQVRMYQFSATAKRIECVVFDSVGGRDNNQGIEIKVGIARRQEAIEQLYHPGHALCQWQQQWRLQLLYCFQRSSRCLDTTTAFGCKHLLCVWMHLCCAGACWLPVAAADHAALSQHLQQHIPATDPECGRVGHGRVHQPH